MVEILSPRHGRVGQVSDVVQASDDGWPRILRVAGMG